MNTNELIDSLAKDLAPVQPLPRPGMRVAVWLFGAGVYIAILTAVMARSTLVAAANLQLLLPQFVALFAGGLAAAAAFASVVPGYPRRWFVWPAIAVALWVAVLVGAALQEQMNQSVIGATHEWFCVAQITIGAVPLLVALGAMLRRGAPLYPPLTAALGALAVGMLANVGACYSHPHPASNVTLAWHGSAVLALVLACAVGARYVLRWRPAPFH